MGTWSLSAFAGGALVAFAIMATSAPAEQPQHRPPAGQAPRSTAGPGAVAAATKALPNYNAMVAMIDKIFPPLPDPDPARLASARTSVNAMWPDGAYAKMMSGFIGNIMTGVMQVKKSDLASLGPKAAKGSEKAAVADPSIHDQAVAKDPYFDQRMAATLGVIHEEIGKISSVIDPRMREGLARSMARRFDAKELADINAFFATPSGHALASEYLQLWFEPDTLRSMFGAFPELVKLMPDMMQKLKAVNDKFPKPPAPTANSAKH